MHAMELKAHTKSYKKLNEIHADILSIKHNVAVYHGSKHLERFRHLISYKIDCTFL